MSAHLSGSETTTLKCAHPHTFGGVIILVVKPSHSTFFFKIWEGLSFSDLLAFSGYFLFDGNGSPFCHKWFPSLFMSMYPWENK